MTGGERFRALVENVVRRERLIVERTDLVQAAVLVPIVFRGDEPRLLFTRRTMTVARHKGQISFPGGAREPGDVDAAGTALREAKEEIDLDPGLVQVVGLLDDYATTSGFVITPVVGYVDARASFTLDPAEVTELFEVPIATLDDPSIYELKEWTVEGRTRVFHSYAVGERLIWGATAAIVHRFLQALKEV